MTNRSLIYIAFIVLFTLATCHEILEGLLNARSKDILVDECELDGRRCRVKVIDHSDFRTIEDAQVDFDFSSQIIRV